MIKLAVSAFVVCLLVACGSSPKVVYEKPIIKTIALIPATPPKRYMLENVSALQFVIPLAATVNYLDSKEKAKLFNEMMKTQQPTLAADLTSSVANALKSSGYEVRILQDITRPADDPDNVDYEKMPLSDDAIIQLKLSDVGLFSPRSSTDYHPRVNAKGTLYVIKQNRELYDEEIVYGVDARKGSIFSIAAEDRFAFPTFEAVTSNADRVRESFDTGVVEIGKRMSEQLIKAMR